MIIWKRLDWIDVYAFVTIAFATGLAVSEVYRLYF